MVLSFQVHSSPHLFINIRRRRVGQKIQTRGKLKHKKMLHIFGVVVMHGHKQAYQRQYNSRFIYQLRRHQNQK